MSIPLREKVRNENPPSLSLSLFTIVERAQISKNVKTPKPTRNWQPIKKLTRARSSWVCEFEKIFDRSNNWESQFPSRVRIFTVDSAKKKKRKNRPESKLSTVERLTYLSSAQWNSGFGFARSRGWERERKRERERERKRKREFLKYSYRLPCDVDRGSTSTDNAAVDSIFEFKEPARGIGVNLPPSPLLLPPRRLFPSEAALSKGSTCECPLRAGFPIDEIVVINFTLETRWFWFRVVRSRIVCRALAESSRQMDEREILVICRECFKVCRPVYFFLEKLTCKNCHLESGISRNCEIIFLIERGRT